MILTRNHALIFAAFILCAITSAAQAKTLLCSNTGIITREMVQIVASYDPQSNPDDVLVEGTDDEIAEHAYFLINLSDVGALSRCIAEYGLAPKQAAEAIRMQWDRLINPEHSKLDPEDIIAVDPQGTIFINRRTGRPVDSQGRRLGSAISRGSLHEIQGKPVLITAVKEISISETVGAISHSIDGNELMCLLNEGCLAKIGKLFND